jgi:hypothetical protein
MGGGYVANFSLRVVTTSGALAAKFSLSKGSVKVAVGQQTIPAKQQRNNVALIDFISFPNDNRFAKRPLANAIMRVRGFAIVADRTRDFNTCPIAFIGLRVSEGTTGDRRDRIWHRSSGLVLGFARIP